MDSMINRMIRAAKLDASLYKEIENDDGALGQAITVVILASAAAGLGFLLGGLFTLLIGAIAAIASWAIWACVIYFVGVKVMPDPETDADLRKVLCATGFASAPGVLKIVSFIPILGWIIGQIANLWMLAAFVVAVREALNYQSTGKAVLVCVIGFVIQMAVTWLLILLPLGGALVLMS